MSRKYNYPLFVGLNMLQPVLNAEGGLLLLVRNLGIGEIH